MTDSRPIDNGKNAPSRSQGTPDANDRAIDFLVTGDGPKAWEIGIRFRDAESVEIGTKPSQLGRPILLYAFGVIT